MKDRRAFRMIVLLILIWSPASSEVAYKMNVEMFVNSTYYFISLTFSYKQSLWFYLAVVEVWQMRVISIHYFCHLYCKIKF